MPIVLGSTLAENSAGICVTEVSDWWWRDRHSCFFFILHKVWQFDSDWCKRGRLITTQWLRAQTLGLVLRVRYIQQISTCHNILCQCTFGFRCHKMNLGQTRNAWMNNSSIWIYLYVTQTNLSEEERGYNSAIGIVLLTT